MIDEDSAAACALYSAAQRAEHAGLSLDGECESDAGISESFWSGLQLATHEQCAVKEWRKPLVTTVVFRFPEADNFPIDLAFHLVKEEQEFRVAAISKSGGLCETGSAPPDGIVTPADELDDAPDCSSVNGWGYGEANLVDVSVANVGCATAQSVAKSFYEQLAASDTSETTLVIDGEWECVLDESSSDDRATCRSGAGAMTFRSES